ncbi:hypothetical protein ACIBQ1_60115 [Nonomuraea sp. NPDC050153]|uniref:hypothetical protein n=1 Tax=Nonomuraea sp. NPDC050153 TaxID=3364359 RepID=UPI0037B0315F
MMKRRMVATVLMVAVSTATAGPAVQADAVVDPASAIQRQLVPGHGVKIVQRDRTYWFGGWSTLKPVRGVVGFGKGKIVATDMKDLNLGLQGTRNICIGKRGYESYVKPDPEDPLPPGKTWVSHDGRMCQFVLKSGFVDLADPTTLRAVLATTTGTRPAGVYDGVRTTLYQGTITFAQLSKAKPGMRIGFRSKPTGKYGTWKVSWRLWIGRDQLVRRAWSSWREPNDSRDRSFDYDPYYAFVEDLRLSDWGMKVHIVPPPADETVPVEELID